MQCDRERCQGEPSADENEPAKGVAPFDGVDQPRPRFGVEGGPRWPSNVAGHSTTVTGQAEAMTALDLTGARRASFAALVEDAQRTLGRIRYGSVFAVGTATVVLNPDSPLPSANFAGTVTGSPASAQATLEALPMVWAEDDRSSVVLLDSPSCLPELSLLAEETGYEAAEEIAVLVLTDPAALVAGEPGRVARPVAEADEWQIAGVVAEAFGWSEGVAQRHGVVLGHRLDDPRFLAVGAGAAGGYDEPLAAVATAFVDAGLGMVSEVAVLPDARGSRLGRAVASAAAASCLARGARVVCLSAEAGGTVERFWTGLGFETAYEAVAYTRWL
ncbi:MAG: hypothetical protein NVSMB13_19450 [Mycobacteriales bacterium]